MLIAKKNFVLEFLLTITSKVMLFGGTFNI